MSKRLVVVTEQELLRGRVSIFDSRLPVYYLADDFVAFQDLKRQLPSGVLIQMLGDRFGKTVQDLMKPFLALGADLAKRFEAEGRGMEWWSTHLASRNAVASPLFKNLIYLSCAIQIMRDDPGPGAIFVVRSLGLARALVQNVREQGWEVEDRTRRTFRFEGLRTRFRLVLKAAYFVTQSARRVVWAKWSGKPHSMDPGRSMVILRSWITQGNLAEDGTYKDRNFGILPKWLDEKGWDVFVLPMFFNLGTSLREQFRRMRRSQQKFLLPEDYLRWGDYLSVLRTGLRQLGLRFEGLRLEGLAVDQIFREVQLQQGLNTDLLYLGCCVPLIQRIRQHGASLKAVFYPIENNAPEKPFLRVLRASFPHIPVLGYQHTVWFQRQPSMVLVNEELDTHPVPDFVLCNGRRYREILTDCGFPPERLVLGQSLRFVDVFASLKKPETTGAHPPTVLSILNFNTGHSLEMLLSLREAIRSLPLALRSKVRVLIKPHPLNDLSRLKAAAVDWTDGRPEFVGGSVNEWMGQADVVIDTGASVTLLEAVIRGIPVIRFAPSNCFHLDPLWEEYLLPIVREAGAFGEVLQGSLTLEGEKRVELTRIGQQVLERYFEPLDAAKFDIVLSSMIR